MNILKSAKIIDPTNSFHGNTLDVLIRNGIIDKIDKSRCTKASVIEHKNPCVSLGWFDSSIIWGACYEERETLDHGLSVAASGFTQIAYNTNTKLYPHQS